MFLSFSERWTSLKQTPQRRPALTHLQISAPPPHRGPGFPLSSTWRVLRNDPWLLRGRALAGGMFGDVGHREPVRFMTPKPPVDEIAGGRCLMVGRRRCVPGTPFSPARCINISTASWPTEIS